MRWDKVIKPKKGRMVVDRWSWSWSWSWLSGTQELGIISLVVAEVGRRKVCFWGTVIATKYGEDVWGSLVEVPRHRASGLWGNILRARDGSPLGAELFSRIVGFKVGEGSRVHF